MKEILENLNPAQREAVINYEGPSLIVAGAGSGKTRVLTARIAYMIESGVVPWSILALTFTNKAAAEMRERIEGMIGTRSKYIQMGTFHSVFLRILRAEGERLGYPPAFTIYDTTDSVSLVRSICRDMSLGDNDKYKPRNVFGKISRLKNDLITPEAYAADSTLMNADRKRGQERFFEIYRRYTAQCKANGAMDFDDLLLNMVVLLKNHADVLEKYREKFRYILVDEYQDTNHVQYLIVKALAMAHGNVCVVGDDSQSIYSFRGARIENILGFKRDFPAAKVYKLEQNYRSTQVIVSAANGVIARNGSSLELKKECFSAGERGENIKLLKAYTDREEAELVAGEIRQLARGGVSWDEIAVLYRVNALSRGIEEALRRRDIPYRIYRGHSFFDRKEIKDLLGYFRLIVNPKDDEAFKRVVNYPARGIGEVTVGRVAEAAKTGGLSLWEAAVASEDKKIRGFTELVSSLALRRAELGLYEFGLEVATRTGIIGSYKADNSAESISALENIDELLNSMVAPAPASDDEEATPFTLEDWLGNVALMTDMDSADSPEERNTVTLMTVHSSKGLEFSHVFIVGLEEELFPSVRDGDASEIEEERRLFYVALTRAKTRSFVSMAETRYIHGKMDFRRPSRFVREIDARFLDGSVSDDGAGRPVGGSNASRSAAQAAGRASGGGWGRPAWETNRYAQPAKEGRPEAHGKEGWRSNGDGVAGIAPGARFRKLGVSDGTARGAEQPASCPPGGDSLGGEPKAPAPIPGTIAPGTRVLHAKFGRGTVDEVSPMVGGSAPGDLKITVTFDNSAHGRKTLLSKFANLKVL
ncbi:MAG: UvrD-helicase domain-containing protein [Alistipes sp.]|jgi:DNA helicase-2/ATP-dependent DNA helicase PcrA|nr:UvrD-helicase domain-containing protein [Alistipes sp.]